MTDYNDYITAVNKIFDYLAKMKAGWNNMDNMNYIESIEEYKDKVISNAEKFKQASATPATKPEALGDNNEPTPAANKQKIESLPNNELKLEESEESHNGVTDDSLEALGDD